MNYLILKSLHIISVVTWFAGLFYMPRLFIYFAEAENKSVVEKEILQSQFKIMQKRLWFGITWPSAIMVLLFGGSMLHQFLPLSDHPWMISKLFFVIGLYAYHFFLHKIFREQSQGIINYSPIKLRFINEISTIFLFAIVFLVVLKSTLNMLYGLVGLFIFICILIVAIKIYKNLREKNELR